MTNWWCLGIFTEALVVSVLLGAASWAEDFSVDLKRLVEIDEARPLPEHKLESVLRREDNRDVDLPWKAFDVFIRFAEFGSVRLDGSSQSGPSSGKIWQKGTVFYSGLTNLMDARIAWIKNSPDLCIVAWVVEPDPFGSSRDQSHGYAIMQLSDRRVAILLRGRTTITAKLRNGTQEGVIEKSRFSFDAKQGFLREQLTRDYEEWHRDSDRPRALARRQNDEEGNAVFVAHISETIMLEYKLADGKLQPRKGSLIYHAKEHDELHEVARFYLGPYAPQGALLEANADLAMKYKNSAPGTFINLEPGTKIKVPVPEKWLIERFSRTIVEPIE